jgi:Arc/MetJ-type ribon-helix-helix transcriptional regulator
MKEDHGFILWYDVYMSTRKERVTVTLDRALVEAANVAVASGRVDSVSAWVNLALAEHVAKERRLTALASLLADYEAEYGVITPQELALREREDRRNAIVVRGSAKPSTRKRRSKAA